ncbi:uncharacterized protein LOC113351697 [Papaver somniferum]|uniref:uncharacterized protein LOC113351697 n=1 Tax=Papaver somniferum TaxID=3469 RepID=UPI000E6F4C46|nr:uncharacterized protein LOC113351697 [Papaver somniferum]
MRRFSLIGRLDLVNLRLSVAEPILRKQWALTGTCQFIRIGKGFFIIKPVNEEDIKLVYEGLWEVDSQFLKLRFWERDFKPEEQNSSSAFVWMLFPGLSIEYWREDILMSMGSAIGRPIHIDSTTLKKVVGYYASILVEIDITKTIPNKVVVESNLNKRLGYLNFLNSVEGKNCEEEEVAANISAFQNTTPAVNKNKDFNGLLESPINFPPLSVEKIIDVGARTPTSEGWKEVTGSIAKFKNAHNIINSGTYFASPGKFQSLVKVAEKQEHMFSKVISKPVKGKKLKNVPNVVTRKQANNSVKSISNMGNTEPKINVSSSDFKSLNLPGMSKMVIHNSTDYKKRNIWLFWNSSLSRPGVVSSTTQAITVQVGDVMVTGIHAACLTVDKRDLWEELINISQRNFPWMIIGDFNLVLSYDEKTGGRRPLRISMQEFRNCLETCNLIQATRTGIKYSWCNNRAGKKRILYDIDKAFYNLKWLEKFTGWSYKVGARDTSDHGPLFGSIPILKKWNWEVFGDLRIKMKTSEDEVLAATLLSDADPENITLLNDLQQGAAKKFCQNNIMN